MLKYFFISVFMEIETIFTSFVYISNVFKTYENNYKNL